ncbi:hypothetical protein ACFYP4_19630 [Streptomyces sp. NPDC005551]|uniref:hypothetical protein n=1 Tax=unclassified Streptomyces TaxID=2593676 RepID=UPI0033E97BC0
MPTTPDEPAATPGGSADTPAGALLLCRADPAAVGSAARLLREPMELVAAGPGWSVLVPAGTPWAGNAEPVDRVLTGWAAALAVGSPWPVLALWWDADRSGYTLASGFRRPVGYEWLANGTPVGEDEAMHTFAVRLGLDPVLDMQALDRLTQPDAAADARARLSGLLAVLMRAGVTLPDGLAPGTPAGRLTEAARGLPGSRPVTRADRSGVHESSDVAPDRVRAEPDAAGDRAPEPPFRTVRAGPGTGAETRRTGTRALALGQLAVGLPLSAYGVRHRSGGWIVAGALLLLHGALGLAYDRRRDQG